MSRFDLAAPGLFCAFLDDKNGWASAKMLAELEIEPVSAQKRLFSRKRWAAVENQQWTIQMRGGHRINVVM